METHSNKAKSLPSVPSSITYCLPFDCEWLKSVSRSGVEGEKSVVLISHVLLTVITMKSRKAVKLRASRDQEKY